jgi:hypothetical protein
MGQREEVDQVMDHEAFCAAVIVARDASNPPNETTQHDDGPTYHGPRVELLVIADCPYATLAEALLRVTLNELGLPRTPVHVNMIETTVEATRRNFVGSPTIRINGIDPWAKPDGEPRLACRLHPSPAGLPTQFSLAQALCAAVVDDQRPTPAESRLDHQRRQ